MLCLACVCPCVCVSSAIPDSIRSRPRNRRTMTSVPPRLRMHSVASPTPPPTHHPPNKCLDTTSSSGIRQLQRRALGGLGLASGPVQQPPHGARGKLRAGGHLRGEALARSHARADFGGGRGALPAGPPQARWSWGGAGAVLSPESYVLGIESDNPPPAMSRVVICASLTLLFILVGSIVVVMRGGR